MAVRHLTPEAWTRARTFLRDHARPLEWHGFRHAFEGAPAEDVIEALAAFRASDGGFGNGLEPDVHTPHASALATGMALRHLAKLGAPPDHPLVNHAVTYLVATLDPTRLVWRVIPERAQRAPHAPWWDDAEGGLDARFGGYRVIPRALILGALLALDAWRAPRASIPALSDLVADQMQAIAQLPALGTGGGSDLEVVAYLASQPRLEAADRNALSVRVAAAVSKRTVVDPEAWTSYGLTPLRAAPRPTVPGAEAIRPAVEAHLDWSLDRQDADGSWAPTWSWASTDPQAWAASERAWRGVLTLAMLGSLRAYGRLGGS